VIAACGKVEDAPPDASDAGVDAPPALVKVTVLTYAADGAPDVAAQMVFQDPAGNVVFEGPVDAMGKLEAMLPTGGTVTEVRIVSDTPTLLRAEITTITGVEPGDDLTFGVAARATIANQGGQTTMSASYAPSPGATSHLFFTTCGTSSAGTTSPVTLVFRDSCHGPTFDLVGIAQGGTVTTPRYVRLTGINHVNGQSFTIPGGFVTMSNFAVNVQNVPAEVSSMSVSRSSMLDHAAVGTQSVFLGDPPAGAVATTLPYAPAVGTRAEVSLSMARSDAPGSQVHAVHTATVASSIDLDLDRQRVPWLSGRGATPTGATWTTAVPGDVPDGMVTTWTGRWVIGSRTTIVTWRIAHAPSATGISLPRLSPAHAAVDPQAQAVEVTPTTGSVLAVNYDVIDGYAEFRRQPDTLVFSPVDDMGALLGMPFQRRLYSTSLPPQMP
jgi:hypothetical protein